MKSSPETTRADEAASEWAVQLAAGPLSAADRQVLTEWLERDERNRVRLEHYQRVYAQLGEAVPRLVDSGELVEEESGRRHPPLPGYGATSATPLHDTAVLHPARAIFRRWGTALAAAAAIAVAAVWWSDRSQLLSTRIAQRQTINLADGSQVELNAHTSLAVRLRRNERFVQLDEGEAFFKVAHDASRPFFVETPAGTVRVTGTQFNVRSAGPGQLEVTVLEGSVAVAPGALASNHNGGFALTANDQLAFDGARSGIRKLSPEATADAVAWREGWVAFDNEPLGSAVQRFGRYHGREIEISPEAAALAVGGRFKLDELDEFLRDVAQTLPVGVLRSGEGKIRVFAR